MTMTFYGKNRWIWWLTVSNRLEIGSFRWVFVWDFFRLAWIFLPLTKVHQIIVAHSKWDRMQTLLQNGTFQWIKRFPWKKHRWYKTFPSSAASPSWCKEVEFCNCMVTFHFDRETRIDEKEFNDWIHFRKILFTYNAGNGRTKHSKHLSSVKYMIMHVKYIGNVNDAIKMRVMKKWNLFVNRSTLSLVWL